MNKESNNLVCNTTRNGGALSSNHTLKLQHFLQQAIELYAKPVVVHYRISFVGVEERLPDVTAYLQNRFNREKLRVSFVKATENKDDGSYLHQHLFLIVDTQHPDLTELEVLDELHQCFFGLKANGLIYSFMRNSKKVVGEYGTTWLDYPTPWFPLTIETSAEAEQWISYALKKRSKCVEGRARVTWSLPRPAGQRSRKGKPPVQRSCLRRGDRHGF